MAGAFQPDAFQDDAFQVDASGNQTVQPTFLSASTTVFTPATTGGVVAHALGGTIGKRVILGIDNRIRDVRQAIATAKKQRDQEVFKVPAAGGSFSLGGGTNEGTGWLPDGTGDGYWGANGERLCIPVSSQQYELTESGSLFVNDSGQDIKDVYFDHLLAEDSQYTRSGNTVQPVATLLPGTRVTATLRPE